MVLSLEGNIVTFPFPYTDLTSAKRRPCLVVKEFQGEDVVLCLITTQKRSDNFAIPLENIDFVSGGLRIESCVRCNRLFTASKRCILNTVGKLEEDTLRKIKKKYLIYLLPKEWRRNNFLIIYANLLLLLTQLWEVKSNALLTIYTNNRSTTRP